VRRQRISLMAKLLARERDELERHHDRLNAGHA
jgi:hypothetical protein